jgi:hypothetical protein
MAPTRTGYVGKTSEATGLPQEQYSLCPAMPFLLKPLYIIRRQITTSNAESTQASAKKIKRSEQLVLNPSLADRHFGIDRRGIGKCGSGFR